MTVQIGLSDGQAHDIALYAVDWNNQGISEQIQLSNTATGAVLGSQTISSFSGGAYLQWRVFGSVTITVTRLAGPDAVLSGLFFDPPSVATSEVVPATGVFANRTPRPRETGSRPTARRAAQIENSSKLSVCLCSSVRSHGLHVGGQHERPACHRDIQLRTGGGFL